jgi:hypothetical protein
VIGIIVYCVATTSAVGVAEVMVMASGTAALTLMNEVSSSFPKDPGLMAMDPIRFFRIAIPLELTALTEYSIYTPAASRLERTAASALLATDAFEPGASCRAS